MFQVGFVRRVEGKVVIREPRDLSYPFPITGFRVAYYSRQLISVFICYNQGKWRRSPKLHDLAALPLNILYTSVLAIFTKSQKLTTLINRSHGIYKNSFL
jgi:hypothetical protein